jgi:hypothetical protein
MKSGEERCIQDFGGGTRKEETTWKTQAYISDVNLLKPSGFFTYHQVSHSKILHGTRFVLSVLYGSQNRK